jgi:membrane protease YdiL (CAAX protease family)
MRPRATVTDAARTPDAGDPADGVGLTDPGDGAAGGGAVGKGVVGGGAVGGIAGEGVTGGGIAGGGAGEALGRRGLVAETWLLLGVSLGMSGLFALIRYVGAVTQGPVRGQVARLNGSAAPGRPWLDLALQLAGLLSDVMPAFLAIHLLARHCGPFPLRGRPAGQGRWARLLDGGAFGAAQDLIFRQSPRTRRGRAVLGLNGRRLGMDLGLGAAIAAVVGGTGLGLYLIAWHSGANLTVAPSGLPDVWWRIPVLLLSALQNAVTEEVIVGGYLLLRLRELGSGNRRALAASALLRGSYHLYQGLGGFFGNVAMGVLFGWLFQRRGRVLPMIVAHTLIDSVAFVGYVALAGSVSWLPTPR